MTLIKRGPVLTDPNPEITRKAQQSYPGMAHFAGEGPPGMTCLDCKFFGVFKHTWSSKTGNNHGRIKPAECQKYRSMMQGNLGARVPDNAAACRYFEQHEKPPERFQK